MHAVGANYGQDTKTIQKNPTATFEELGAKARYCACPLHATPAKGWTNHLSPPLARTLDTPLPSSVRNHLGLASASKRICGFCSLLLQHRPQQSPA